MRMNRATITSYARSMRVMQADNAETKAYVFHAKHGFTGIARDIYNDACKNLVSIRYREADRMADATLDAYLPRIETDD